MMTLMSNWQSGEAAPQAHTRTFILLNWRSLRFFCTSSLPLKGTLSTERCFFSNIFHPVIVGFGCFFTTPIRTSSAFPCFFPQSFLVVYSTSWYRLCTVKYSEVHFSDDVRKLAVVTMALAQTRKTASEMASDQTGLVWGPEAGEEGISHQGWRSRMVKTERRVDGFDGEIKRWPIKVRCMRRGRFGGWSEANSTFWAVSRDTTCLVGAWYGAVPI